MGSARNRGIYKNFGILKYWGKFQISLARQDKCCPFFFYYIYRSLQINVLASNLAATELRSPLSTFPDL
jgi:hypothetical protein